MFNRFFFTLLCILTTSLVSCNLRNNRTSNFKSHAKDSLFYYLNKAKDKSIILPQRLTFIDSAFKITTKRPLDSLSLAIIAYKSSLNYKQHKKDSTLFYDRLLLKKATEINNDYYMGVASKNLAIYHKNKKYVDSSYYYFNQSKQYFQNLKDSSQIGRRLMSMAQIQQNQGDYMGSKETITEAIQYLSSNNKYLASSYNDLATNHKELLNFQDAIKYYKLAITTSTLKNDKLVYQNNLATVFIDNKEYKKAIAILQKIKSDAILKNHPTQYARIIDNLAYANWLIDKKDYKSILLKALQLRIDYNDGRGQIASYLHLGEYYLGFDKQKSKQYLHKAIKKSRQLKTPKGELEALQFLMKLNPNKIVVKDRFIALNDSLYTQELKAKTQFAKYKYDNTLKQKAITNLTLDKKQKAIEISKQKTQKISAFLLSIITIISGFFLFYYLKQRHKKEKLKEIYTTETRISRKVHDELANDVYDIMNRIQNKSQLKQEAILKQLEEVYQKTRDISYENSTINLSDTHFHLELKEMLKAYQNKDVGIITKGLNKELWRGLSDYKKIVIVRVLKELMTNMKKHSKASNVVLTFKKERKKLIITYADDGVGLKNTDNFKRNGLQNAENRIRHINGTLIFDTNSKKGVKLTISIPV